jgi:hypothetical protein
LLLLFSPQTKSEPSKNFKQYDSKISLISERRESPAVETAPVAKNAGGERQRTEVRSGTWRNIKPKLHPPQYTHKNARERTGEYQFLFRRRRWSSYCRAGTRSRDRGREFSWGGIWRGREGFQEGGREEYEQDLKGSEEIFYSLKKNIYFSLK